MKSKDKIAEQFREDLAAAQGCLGGQYDNIRKCQAFYAGDMMSYADSINVTDGRGRMKSVMVQFNKTKPYINAVRGFMAQNRRRPQCLARVENNDLQGLYSQYGNALMGYVRDIANADQVETQQDGDMLIGGLGAVETNITYGVGQASSNPNGTIGMMRLDPVAVGYDPQARDTNLLSARYVYYRREYPREEAYELFDDRDPQSFESAYVAETGNKIPWPAGGRYDKIQEIFDVADKKKDLVKVYFYQWYEIEPYYRAKNPLSLVTDQETGAFAQQRMADIAKEQEYPDDQFSFKADAEIISCDAKTKKKLEELFDGFDIGFDDFNRKCYYTAVLSGKKVFSAYRSISQTGFTIKFKTGDWDDSRKVWVGMANQMMDPVVYFNKALTELMFTIASSAKGGVIAERSAIDDIQDFEQTYAKTDSVTIVNDGAVQNNQIRPKREPYSPNGVEELIQISDAAIGEVSGIDKSFLGSSENKLENAALQRQRVKQVTTTLATYFDAITLYQRENARLLLDLLKVFVENNDGSLFRMVDQETGQAGYTRVTKDSIAPEYDVEIVEGPDSATEKEERAILLNNMGDKLLAAGDPAAKLIYAISVKNLNLDQDDKRAIREALVPNQERPDPAYVKQLETALQQAQSQTAEMELKKTAAETALSMARIEEINASVRNKNVNSAKAKAETEQTIVETDLIAHGAGNAQVNVSA